MGQLFDRLARMVRAELRNDDDTNRPTMNIDAYMQSDDEDLRRAIDELSAVESMGPYQPTDDPEPIRKALRELGLKGNLADYTFAQIKSAYAGEVRHWHPDVYADGSAEGRKLAEMHLININAAFEVLKHEYE